eukprot:4967173-Lingulodinium_polyedra.AAC.1
MNGTQPNAPTAAGPNAPCGPGHRFVPGLRSPPQRASTATWAASPPTRRSWPPWTAARARNRDSTSRQK